MNHGEPEPKKNNPKHEQETTQTSQKWSKSWPKQTKIGSQMKHETTFITQKLRLEHHVTSTKLNVSSAWRICACEWFVKGEDLHPPQCRSHVLARASVVGMGMIGFREGASLCGLWIAQIPINTFLKTGEIVINNTFNFVHLFHYRPYIGIT